jgi:hypothetical protein
MVIHYGVHQNVHQVSRSFAQPVLQTFLKPDRASRLAMRDATTAFLLRPFTERAPRVEPL